MRAAILFLLLIAAGARAADGERFDARATLARAKVGSHAPSAQPSVRVEVIRPARYRARGHGNRRIQQHFERMDCRWQESTGSMRCVAKRAEEVNRPKK